MGSSLDFPTHKFMPLLLSGCSGAVRLAAETPPVTEGFPLSLSACLYIPLTWLFITMGFCKACINHLDSEPKKRHREADAIKRAAQLSFPSRQPSLKITGTWSIHLRAERAPLWARFRGL